MPPCGPVSRRRLISGLRKLGFTGPYSGGRHEFMVRGTTVLTVPNPHSGDIGVKLLSIILKQGGLSRAEWERV